MTKWMKRLLLRVLCMILLLFAFFMIGRYGWKLGYEKTWTLPVALSCNALALLYQSIFRMRNK